MIASEAVLIPFLEEGGVSASGKGSLKPDTDFKFFH